MSAAHWGLKLSRKGQVTCTSCYIYTGSEAGHPCQGQAFYLVRDIPSGSLKAVRVGCPERGFVSLLSPENQETIKKIGKVIRWILSIPAMPSSLEPHF